MDRDPCARVEVFVALLAAWVDLPLPDALRALTALQGALCDGNRCPVLCDTWRLRLAEKRRGR